MFRRVSSLITGKSHKKAKAPKVLTERNLIEMESKLGQTIFGPVPKGARREFFCLDKDTWVWYEEWTDENKQRRSRMIRYELQEKGVLKVQNSKSYCYIEGDELQNFHKAINVYYERVMRNIYKRDPRTGQFLSA